MDSRNKFGLFVISVVVLTALFIRIKNFTAIPVSHDPQIIIAGVNYPVLTAFTHDEQVIGLGGKENLGKYIGMYFKFDALSNYGIVMRDMLFPIDVIWLNGSEVVHVEQNLPLEPGVSENNLKIYLNRDKLADGVLEVAAGKVAELGLKLGDQVYFCQNDADCRR